MGARIPLPVLSLIAGIAVGVIGPQPLGAQQQLIKRTDLLKTELTEMKDSEMHVWAADVAPGAQTGRHTHPTPRFVYVLEGAVVVEIDGRQPQIFKAGEAFVETPNQLHNFRNASTSEPAKALGFQYAAKGQPLQTSAP